MQTIRWRHALIVIGAAAGLALLAASCSEDKVPERLAPQATQQAAQKAASDSMADMHSGSSYAADVTYTLGTNISGGKLVFIGVGGNIDGAVNPTLKAPVDALVQITLVNQDGAEHDIMFEAYNAKTDHVLVKGSSSTTSFRASKAGESVYFCTLPGHRAAGMEGTLLVGGAALPSAPAAPSIVRDPTDTQSRFFQAIALTQTGMIDEAISVTRRLVAVDPLAPLAMLMDAIKDWFVGGVVASMPAAQRAAAADPGNLLMRWTVAYGLTTLGELDGAQREVDAMRATMPDMPYAVQADALLRAVRGDLAGARTLVDGLDLTPFDAHLTFHYAEVHAVLGELDRALEVMALAIRNSAIELQVRMDGC